MTLTQPYNHAVILLSLPHNNAIVTQNVRSRRLDEMVAYVNVVGSPGQAGYIDRNTLTY